MISDIIEEGDLVLTYSTSGWYLWPLNNEIGVVQRVRESNSSRLVVGTTEQWFSANDHVILYKNGALHLPCDMPAWLAAKLHEVVKYEEGRATRGNQVSIRTSLRNETTVSSMPEPRA